MNQEKNKRIPKIIFNARDDGGCGFFRCIQPANYIKRMGLADTEVFIREVPREKLLQADLVVIQDTGSPTGTQTAQFCLAHKIPYITEFDDFVQHVSPHNLHGYPAWNPGTLYIHRAMEMAKAAMGITVSTNQLAREYFPYNPTIYVVPNYLDEEKWVNPITKRNDGKIRIGWCGGNAHGDDLKMISKVLHKIVKEHKGNVVFETLGMTKQELAGVFPFSEFSASCPHCGYEGELHHYPGESQNDYPFVLASKGWDLAVAPVIDNSFGNAKSDLKIKEYSAAGIPIIASPIVPYREAAASNAQVVFASTFEEWYNGLNDLIRHPEKRDEMARKNREWIKDYWIQNNAQKIFQVYEQVLQKAALVLGKRNML